MKQDLLAIGLDEVATLCRQLGIKKLQYGSFLIELGPLPPPVSPHESYFPDEMDKLPCGHGGHEANEHGECLHGCMPPPVEEE